MIRRAYELEAKFWWLMIRYRLIPTTTNNTLMQEGVALVACMIADYNVDFSFILQNELQDRVFVKLSNLPLLCIIQRMCDEAGMPELP